MTTSRFTAGGGGGRKHTAIHARLPVGKKITLEQNYRSTQRILQVANAVIQNNPERTPKKLWSNRGMGEPVTLVEVEDEMEEAGLREAIRAEESNPNTAERRINNLEEVISGIMSYEKSVDTPTLRDYIDKISLMNSDEAPRDKPGEGVRLMTIHSAKGLEFPFVLLPGLEEETLPHKRSTESAATLCEERRLFYVAVTRAKTHLMISYARTRHRFNKSTSRIPSRFLSEIPDALLDKEIPGAASSLSPEEEDALEKEFFSNIRRMLNN